MWGDLVYHGLRAVGVSFDSKHGPLTYETAEFATWQDNLRAIALGLEALRAVDRYGISKRGEQYRGWKALPMSSDDTGIHDEAQAREWLAQWGGDARKALFETHPDRGGDDLAFRKTIRARELLA